MASITTNKLIALTVKPGLLIAVLGFTLTGCEAPLNLQGIEQEKAKSVRRTDHFQSIVKTDHVIVAVGNDGLILTRDKTAADWQRHVIATEPNLIAVTSCPDQSLAALSTNKEIWTSQNNGQSWLNHSTGTQEELLALGCAPDNSIWAVGSFSTILNSSDKGASWTENSLNEDAMLTGIQFIDNSNVMITGEFGLLSNSNDGGHSWNPPEYIPNEFYIQGAHFKSLQEGWVGGLSGQIQYTRDGGASWTMQITPTESPVYSFYETDSSLFALGDHATVMEYSGADWKHIPAPAKPVYLRDAIQLDNGDLLVAGGSGSLFTLGINTTPSPVNNTQISQK